MSAVLGAAIMRNTLVIDCQGIGTEAQFWDRYVDAIPPESRRYFGRNLDAFNDALAGGPGWPGDVDVQFLNAASLRGIRDGDFLSALEEITAQSGQITFS
jgi:ribonuclease inhibitor